MKLLNDYIFIKEIEPLLKKTEGGLELSIEHRDDARYRDAEVLEENTEILQINKGDKILYDSANGFDVEVEDTQGKIIRIRDIVFVHEKG